MVAYEPPTGFLDTLENELVAASGAVFKVMLICLYMCAHCMQKQFHAHGFTWCASVDGHICSIK